jgi:hypothetical protein
MGRILAPPRAWGIKLSLGLSKQADVRMQTPEGREDHGQGTQQFPSNVCHLLSCAEKARNQQKAVELLRELLADLCY